MPSSLGLALRLFDREPAASARCGMLTNQLWKGGTTDLHTRAMRADPPRWLLLADHHADQPPPDAVGWLLAWDLEQILPGGQASPAGAGGLILVSMDVDSGHDEEFNDWYNTEHIPHLSGVAGVLAARRFRARNGPQPGAPAYVALYHVENTDIYASSSWVTANHTPWMQRMRRYQRNRTYLMFPTSVR